MRTAAGDQGSETLRPSGLSGNQLGSEKEPEYGGDGVVHITTEKMLKTAKKLQRDRVYVVGRRWW
eukprot:4125090-Pyramimonas_sp.AAC.1